MKPDIHPKYYQAKVHCGSCGTEWTVGSTRARAPRRRLRQLPPVLHGQADDHRHGRPGRALPEAPRAPGPQLSPSRPPSGRDRGAAHGRRSIPGPSRGPGGIRPASGRPSAAPGRLAAMPSYTYGGQALIEGVLMRGRDAIAVALRHPDGRIVFATERLDAGFHGTALVEDAVRPRPRRPVRDARSSAPAGSSAAPTSRRRRTASSSARARSRSCSSSRSSPRSASSSCCRCSSRASRPANVENGLVQHLVEGLIRVAIFLGYLAGHQSGPGHPPRLPVPRRRAHDDPRARGRRPADGRRGPQVPDRPPALRHRVPRHRDHPLDHRVLPRRPADAAGDDREPDPAHPGHRRPSATRSSSSGRAIGRTRSSRCCSTRASSSR